MKKQILQAGISTLQSELIKIQENVDLAADDLAKGSENAAIGSLAMIAEDISNLEALRTAVLMIHKNQNI